MIFVNMSAAQELKKPFGFCCEEEDQHPTIRHNKTPRSASSLTDIIQTCHGLDLRVRLQDIIHPQHAGRQKASKGASKFGNFKSKSVTKSSDSGKKVFVSHCRRCRGPLRWFLEDEIEAARDIFFNERRLQKKLEIKRAIKIAKSKEKKRRGSRKDKHTVDVDKAEGNTEEAQQ